MTPVPTASADAVGDVASLAKKLTKAQRETLATACGGDGLYVTRWKYGRSVRALHAAGLTNAPPGPPPGLIAILTPLGLAVRSHLLSQTTQDDDHG